jgi:glutamate---cysteine ligase / carboxylate-amine ligase
VNSDWPSPITGDSLAERFRANDWPTFGLEEEIMVLDPGSLDLLPRGNELLEGLDGRFKGELPASHVEIATRPHTNFDELAEELANCRRTLAAHVGDRARFAAAGVHPFSARFGDLNRSERYDRLLARYGDVLRQQLVCGLHLHVGLGSPDRTLAVYNVLRAYLPELAALAANASIHDGRDTTLASIRPLISGLLPRMGVPPALESWEAYAAHLNWGLDTGLMGRPAEWWWEMRPHGGLGTLEVRVPDAQTTCEEAAAIGAVVVGLAVWLAGRYDAGDLPPPVSSLQINENRSAALHGGMKAMLVDFGTGARMQAADRIGSLLEAIAPAVAGIGGENQLSKVKSILQESGAERQRRIFNDAGAVALTEWMAEQFLPGTADSAGY